VSTATQVVRTSERPTKARSKIIRILITAAALFVWFWTQSMIGHRTLPNSGIGDGIHTLTAPLNQYLLRHSALANALLIVSSAVIDLLGIFYWRGGSSVAQCGPF